MTLRRLQSQPHPRSHEYINVVSNARRSTSPRLEGRDHRSHSEDYGTIPLQSTAIREQKTFNKVCSTLDICNTTVTSCCHHQKAWQKLSILRMHTVIPLSIN